MTSDISYADYSLYNMLILNGNDNCQEKLLCVFTSLLVKAVMITLTAAPVYFISTTV